MGAMEHTLELLVTVTIAVLGSNGMWAFLQAKSKKKTVQDKMLLGLGHAMIYQTAERYITRGAVTMAELEDLIKYLHGPYKELGGNGSGDAIISKVKALPIATEAEAEQMDKALKEK
jgi:hypothetical protein